MLEKEILDHIQQAHHRQFRVIVMGDFNVNVNNSLINRQHRTLKLNFIYQLAALDIYNCYNLVYKDTTSKVHTTWSHPT